MKLKKGDTVLIISGKDRGKSGKIEKVWPREEKIMVTGANIAKHHLKPSRKNPHGGIIDRLAPINAANAVLVCPRCSRPTRVSYKIAAGKKIRLCRKCKESLDA